VEGMPTIEFIGFFALSLSDFEITATRAGILKYFPMVYDQSTEEKSSLLLS
jgi:hypothetical protein